MPTSTGQRSWSPTVTLRAFLVLLVGAVASGTSRATPPDPISSVALQQIQALLADKVARTPAQRKIDSNLLYEVKQRRGLAIAAGVPTIQTGIAVSSQGEVVVDITARVTDSLLDTLERLGGRVLDYNYAFRSIRGEIPLAVVETLGAHPDVIFVQPKQEAMLNDVVRPARVPGQVSATRGVTPSLLRAVRPGFVARAAAVRSQLAAALSQGAAKGTSGPKPAAINISEGVVTHRANLARSNYGAAGAGVKIGVLSDGVDSLSSLEVSGDLPSVTVLAGQAGSGNEGAAMLEIVHDMAPAAKLYFATAFNGVASFAQNIQDLRTAGCDVIIDDVTYFAETPFQKGQAPSVVSNTNGGLVTQAVNTVTAAGALYFSSAANSGSKDKGTSGTWEGDFADAGAAGPPILESGRLHDFDPGAGVSAYDSITTTGGPATLFWSDPLGGSSNDYDLFLLNSTGTTVVAGSTNLQSGTQDPFEYIGSTPSGDRLVIVKFSGSDRFLHLDTNRGRLTFNTQGSTHGHNAPPNANSFGVAATPAVSPGPYPNPFNFSNMVETFSSDGPRQFFFNADSSAITPGNFSSTGGQIVQQPLVTAADGVSCAAPGFNPFYGTSAAAPHAGAIAALVKSAKPSLTPAQITTFLTSTAIDIEAAGVDRDSGYGILDALAAVQAATPTPQAVLLVGTITLTEASGNGNGYVEPGECGNLTIQLTNGNTTVGATGISATLTTSTPGVTIVIGSSAYPNIAGGASATNTTAFQFSISNSAACPLVIEFTLTVTYTGGPSPQVLSVPVRAGLPAVAVTTTLDTTAPPVVPGVTSTATGLQTGRMTRSGVASSCATPKSYPGDFTATGSRQYDAYTFTDCSSGTACVVVSLTQNSGTTGALFAAAYSASYNPASPGTNYLADAGSSPVLGGTTPFSFSVAAGATFVVVVHEVNPGGGIGASYTLTVDGMCLPCATYTGTGCSTCATITLSPGTLPTGTANTAYTPTTITPSGGTGPYTFNVSGLPAGMTPTGPVVGSSVTIGGTPTAPFSGTITVSGTDSNGCPFSKNYSLTINCPPPPSATITAPAQVCSLSVGNTASVPDAGPGATYAWTIGNGTITAGAGTRTITFTAGSSGPVSLGVTVTVATGCFATGNASVVVDPTCASFYTVQPCRVLDTRDLAGPYGGPALAANADRSFVIAGQCGIPSTAKAVSFNFTITQPTGQGDLRIFPGGAGLPLVSTLNWRAGQTRANNGVVALGLSGDIVAHVDQFSGTVHFIIDVNGYFQ